MPEGQPLFERTECQYCGDAGLCSFCERGQIAIAYYQKQNPEVDIDDSVRNTDQAENKELDQETPEIKITLADKDDGLDFTPFEDLGYKRK